MLNGTLGLFKSARMALRWFRNPWVIMPIISSHSESSKALIRLRSGPKLVIRGSRGLSVPDICILHEVLVEDHYLINSLVKPGNVVVDIGAHIGCFSILAAQRTGKTGKVVGFEPQQHNFELLQANIDINSCYPLEACRIAITGSNRKRQLSTCYANSGGHTLLSEGINQQTVQGWTLETALEAVKIEYIDLLKLDCEGSEFEIIDAAGTECLNRIERIIMEVHDAPYTPRGAVKKLFNKLERTGFTLETIREITYPDEGRFSLVLAHKKW